MGTKKIKTKKVYCSDYYATRYFSDPNLEYIQSMDRSHGICPFCGGDVTSVAVYKFRDKTTDEILEVSVDACYGICECCGAS